MSFRLRTALFLGLACALPAAACGGDDRNDEATPPAIRTAVTQANDIVLTADDVGEGWEALPADTGTPDEAAGGEAILDRAFKAWAGCVGNTLSGGFIGLGRAGLASSPRFADGSGRLVAGATAVFAQEMQAQDVIRALDQTREECAALGSDFQIAIEDVPAAGTDTAASYRMAVSLLRSATFNQTFDLVVLRSGTAVSTLAFKGFGADDTGQAEIVERAAAKLP